MPFRALDQSFQGAEDPTCPAQAGSRRGPAAFLRPAALLALLPCTGLTCFPVARPRQEPPTHLSRRPDTWPWTAPEPRSGLVGADLRMAVLSVAGPSQPALPGQGSMFPEVRFFSGSCTLALGDLTGHDQARFPIPPGDTAGWPRPVNLKPEGKECPVQSSREWGAGQSLVPLPPLPTTHTLEPSRPEACGAEGSAHADPGAGCCRSTAVWCHPQTPTWPRAGPGPSRQWPHTSNLGKLRTQGQAHPVGLILRGPDPKCCLRDRALAWHELATCR